ncbi:MAG: hypothetical protein FJ295_16420 [Planctomycetes bacterium]|nr:hypothetical protein [Planctomycetota bacterium]
MDVKEYSLATTSIDAGSGNDWVGVKYLTLRPRAASKLDIFVQLDAESDFLDLESNGYATIHTAFDTGPTGDGRDWISARHRSLSPSPARHAATEEYLTRILTGVDDFDRRLIQLKLDGHSTAETAEILARDPAFIRMRWARLRQRLRDHGYDHA